MRALKTFRGAAPVDPRDFSTGIDGFAYLDYVSDLSRLRQDNIDTAAAVGQPVGMVFDDWISNTVGSEKVLNGTFDTDTTNWTAAGSATLSVVSANLRVTNSAAAVGRAWQSFTTVVGETYRVTFDVVDAPNGCSMCAGTSNGGSTLLAFIPPGTGSFTAYFIATGTTTFIQCRNNSSVSGHYSQWDNVSVKPIAGRHLLQQTAAARPILRQDALGYYYLEGDGTDDILVGGLSMTLQLPSYLCGAFRRRDGGSTSGHLFGVFKNASSYHRVVYATGQRASTALRETTIGSTTASTIVNVWGADRLIVVDALGLVGSNDVSVARLQPSAIANNWLAGSQLTLSTPGLFAQTHSAAATEPVDIYGACGFLADPGASRAGIRAYLANLCGAD